MEVVEKIARMKPNCAPPSQDERPLPYRPLDVEKLFADWACLGFSPDELTVANSATGDLSFSGRSKTDRKIIPTFICKRSTLVVKCNETFAANAEGKIPTRNFFCDARANSAREIHGRGRCRKTFLSSVHKLENNIPKTRTDCLQFTNLKIIFRKQEQRNLCLECNNCRDEHRVCRLQITLNALSITAVHSLCNFSGLVPFASDTHFQVAKMYENEKVVVLTNWEICFLDQENMLPGKQLGPFVDLGLRKHAPQKFKSCRTLCVNTLLQINLKDNQNGKRKLHAKEHGVYSLSGEVLQTKSDLGSKIEANWDCSNRQCFTSVRNKLKHAQPRFLWALHRNNQITHKTSRKETTWLASSRIRLLSLATGMLQLIKAFRTCTQLYTLYNRSSGMESSEASLRWAHAGLTEAQNRHEHWSRSPTRQLFERKSNEMKWSRHMKNKTGSTNPSCLNHVVDWSTGKRREQATGTRRFRIQVSFLLGTLFLSDTFCANPFSTRENTIKIIFRVVYFQSANRKPFVQCPHPLKHTHIHTP